MADKWKRRVKEQGYLIKSLRSQIEDQRAYERTLQQNLQIAKKDAADARRWADQAEKAMAMERSWREHLQEALWTADPSKDPRRPAYLDGDKCGA